MGALLFFPQAFSACKKRQKWHTHASLKRSDKLLITKFKLERAGKISALLLILGFIK